MSIPVHSDNNIEEGRPSAEAPYNFVPLPNTIRFIEKPPSQGVYNEKLFTGKISCKLTNTTPIYVRAAQTLDEFENKTPSSEHFYHGPTGNEKYKLLIPGSSIRGMLRTLVEVVSHARVSPVTDKQLFYRSVENTSMGKMYGDRMKDKVRAGFFHRDQSGAWITPAIAVRVGRDDILAEFSTDSLYKEQYRNGQPLKTSPKRVPRDELQHQPVFVRLHENSLKNSTQFYRAEEFSREQADEQEAAVLVITGDMHGKEKEFAFLERNIAKDIPLQDGQVELFEDKDQITQYQENAFPKTKGRKNEGGIKDGDPVFYLIGDNEKQIVGFGRAYMFRLPYRLSPLQMLPDNLTEDIDRYDLVEALFGYVPQSNKGRTQIAGRISFTDAIMQGKVEDALLSEKHLKILASPKATAFQHYLTQSQPNDQDKLSHYDTPKEETTLRGYKFYWHKGQVQQSDYEANVPSQEGQHPVKPIRENQTFKFDIFFENLRPEELGVLLWVLDKAKDDQYRLKLGMGKPYGLGSVLIDSDVKIEDRIQRYKTLVFGGNSWKDQQVDPKLEEENNQKLDEARVSFARWLLKKQDVTILQIDELTRIQELLIMLSWNEHPPVNKTQYMVLDQFTGRKSMILGQLGSHFPKRPVLPTPHTVFGRWLKNTSTPSENSTTPPSSKKIKKEQKATPIIDIPANLKSGDLLRAKIIDAPSKGAITLRCENHDEDDCCIISRENRGPDGYKEGKNILVTVISTKKTPGGWVIECYKYA